MNKKNLLIWILVAVCMLGAAGTFTLLQRRSTYAVNSEGQESAPATLDDWKPEDSVANGAPLRENKSVYGSESSRRLTPVYITVFPTKDEEGKLLDFSAFDLHRSRVKTYNPVLNANVQLGTPSGGFTANPSLNTVNATIRVRGNSSRGNKYKSYKVKLKEGVEFEGQTVLNLNKHMNDVSKISNKFAMDLMSPIEDMASMRTYFMQVYIRDASLPEEEQEYRYYGLYTHVEQPNKSYLKSRGFDQEGNMYKANNFEFRLTDELKNVDDPAYDEEAFETILGIREGKNHKKVLSMLEDVNDMNQDFETVFSKYFNEDNYLSWMASSLLLGNEDMIAHNFLIYSPTNSLTWYFLPWDYDGTMRFGEYTNSFQVPKNLAGIQRLSGVPLHRRYFKQSGNVEKLTKRMNDLLEHEFSQSNVQELVDSYKPIMAQTLPLAPDIYCCEIPLNEYNQYVDQFYQHLLDNYQKYLDSLEYPMPVFVSEPVKTGDEGILFAWEPSYDFQQDLVTYHVRVSRNAAMTDLVFEKDGLIENTCYYEKGLPAGTYYLTVSIRDSKGYEQCSLDYYEDTQNGGIKYGIREFTVPQE